MKLFILGIVLFLGQLSSAQINRNIQGEFIVRLQGPYNPQYAVSAFQS